MIQFRLALLAGLIIASGGALAAGAPITGQWLEIDEDTKAPDAQIEIREKEGVFSAVIVKLFPAPGESAAAICDKCTDARRNQPLVGMTVIEGARRKGAVYDGGTILDPETGRTYSVMLSPSDDGRELSVTGYIGVPALGETRHWRRAP
jgi:uncharacterized protein (DUF2147 family)